MKLKAIITVLFLSCSVLEAGLWDAVTNYIVGQEQVVPEKISVLVAHDQPGALLEVTGKYRIYDPNKNKLMSARMMGKKKYIQAVPEGIKWQEEFPGMHQLKIVPDETNCTTYIDGVEYKGAVYIYDIGGTISIVNELNVEDYVSSILADQFNEPGLAEETLSAVAIAARTHAYHQSTNPKNRYWAVDGRQIGFKGFDEVNPSSPVQEAVRLTDGIVLSQDSDMTKVFPALWGSATGGTQEAGVFSRITLFDADDLAKKGHDASMILHKAFPGTAIKMH